MQTNTIVFSNVKTSGIGISSKPLVFKNNGEYVQGVDSKWGGIINAVDIDWNGAQLGNNEINTTGELLSYISELSVSVSELSNILKTPITTEEPTTTQPPTPAGTSAPSPTSLPD